MEKEEFLLNFVSVSSVVTLFFFGISFIILQVLENAPANNLIAASTFGLFLTAFFSLIVTFIFLLRTTKSEAKD
ncbi:hypothetical protein ISI31_000667 [Salmonella enterica]|nr:hypothetical protein [Salmonella enterica]